MKTSDFDYFLPKELIAQRPLKYRDHSRLMVLDKLNSSIEHRRFFDLPNYLNQGDVLVFNDSRVVSARLIVEKERTQTRIEILLLRRLRKGVWKALVKPGKKMRPGTKFYFGSDLPEPIRGTVLEEELDGAKIISVEDEDQLIKTATIAIPPYIQEVVSDMERYQTVYSRAEGSIAAPTAGLHFTNLLLEKLRSDGVTTIFVTLHVGWDSFRPIRTDNPMDHEMHSEYWEISSYASDLLNKAKAEGRRVISVGTTAVRLLEHAAIKQGGPPLVAGSGWADLFISPGYEFKMVDNLITNFHLPKSTLLMLTSALAGKETMLTAYKEAVALKYRFYSFGDAMLIL
jgi:S-adenosylmethionine:tRNA ribosyltransferase-isomerase